MNLLHIKIDFKTLLIILLTMFEPYHKSQFKVLPIENLIIDKKYLIKTFVRKSYINKIGVFTGNNPMNHYSYFDVVMTLEMAQGKTFGTLRYAFNETSYFYEFVSQKEKIQTAMEQRAINQILQGIIGDELFIYIL